MTRLAMRVRCARAWSGAVIGAEKAPRHHLTLRV